MEQMQITNDCSTSKEQLKLFNDPTFRNVNRLFVLPFPRNVLGDEILFQIIMYQTLKLKILMP